MQLLMKRKKKLKKKMKFKTKLNESMLRKNELKKES